VTLVPIALAACEAFIRHLTLRAWAFTQRSKRHTLQRRDLICAIMSDEMYDFLIDITSGAVVAERGTLGNNTNLYSVSEE
jgi:hypothetical protein